MKNMPANIRDVAKKAGVSVASVSRTLNNQNGEVSESIRTRVLEACRELGYQLNPGIQDLVRKGRNGHTRGLAFVVVGQEGFSRHVYAASLDGLAQGSAEGNYTLSLAHMSGDEQTPYELPPILRDKRVDGLLLTGRLNEKIVAVVKELGLPFVILGVYSPRTSGDSVRVQLDVNATVHKIVQEFRKAEKRKIAYLLSDPAIYYAQEFFHAYQKALAENGLAADERVVYRAQPHAGAAIEILREIFARPELPFDGIVCEDSVHAQEIAFLSGMRSGAFGKNELLIATLRASEEYRLPIPAIYFEGPFHAEAYQGVGLLIDLVTGKKTPQGQKLEIATGVYML
jgi:LacI family transcriptional regulator